LLDHLFVTFVTFVTFVVYRLLLDL